MSRQCASIIRQKVRPSRVQLAGLWFFTLLLPITLFIIGSDLFVGEYKSYYEAHALSDAIDKIEGFRSRLNPASYLQRRIKALRRVELRDSQNKPLPVAEVKKKIDDILQVRSVFCAFYDKSAAKVEMTYDKPVDIARHPVPPAFIRPLIQTAIADKTQIAPEDIRAFISKQANAANRAQHTFKAIAPINLKLNRVEKNFSALFGGDLYFVTTDFLVATGEVRGVLMLVRGKELPAALIAESAAVQEVDCRVVLVDYDISAALNHKHQTIADVSVNDGVIRALTPAGQPFYRHFIHDGGLRVRPENPERVPYVAFIHDLNDSLSPITKLLRNVKHILLLLLAFSAVVLIKGCLLGVNFKAGFRARVLLVVVVAASLPFAVFAAALYVNQLHSRLVSKANMIRHLEARFAEISDQLLQFQSEVELTAKNTVERAFAGVAAHDKQALLHAMKKVSQCIPLTRIQYFSADQDLEKSFLDRTSSIYSRQNPDFFVSHFMPVVLRAASEDQTVATDKEALFKFRLDGREHSTPFFNELFVADAGMFSSNLDEIPQWYIARALFDRNAVATASPAVVLMRFEPGMMLKAFFEARNDGFLKDFEEQHGEFKISYGFYPIALTGSTHVWQGEGAIDVDDYDFADDSVSAQIRVVDDSDGAEQIIMNRMNLTFPHRVVAIARLTADDSAFSLANIAPIGAVYLLLVFMLADQLLRAMFVVPALSLAKKAKSIAAGGENWLLELNTGDEFAELNQNFAVMVDGLRQRNLLKDYVADSAITEASRSQQLQLSPGGERRQVTVVFAGVKEFSQLASSGDVHKTIGFLNKFIAVADNVCKANCGEIDKFIEGTIMLVFRAKNEHDQSHALNALHTAAEIAGQMKTAGYSLYAGVASGSVISGRIGSYAGKLDYTVIGDTVNLAARLKSESTISDDAGIIISGATMRLLKGHVRVNFVRRCTLKGKSREYNIYKFESFR